jgi:hypothetical protein
MAGSAVPRPEFAFGAAELLVHGQQPGEVSMHARSGTLSSEGRRALA